MNQKNRRGRARAFRASWILLLAMLAFPSRSALGQTDIGDALGAIYVSRTTDEYEPFVIIDEIPPFSITTFFVVADLDFDDVGAPEQNGLNGIQAWEGQIRFPFGLTLMSAEFVGTNAGVSDSDFLVDVGLPVLLANSTPRALATFTVVAHFEIQPNSKIELLPSENPLARGVLGWREALDSNGCSSPETGAAVECFRPFAQVGNLTFVLQGATEEGSWTAVKEMFR